MLDIKKQCRWSEDALAARPLFTTPELDEITRTIKRELKDFFRSGEGYHTSIIPFSLFACGFVLAYSFEDEIWILEIFVPPSGPRGRGPNIRGRRRNGYERAIITLFDDLRPIWEDWWAAAAVLLYNTAKLIGPSIAAFFADKHGLQGNIGELKACMIAMDRRFSPLGADTGQIAVRLSHACEEVVQLVQQPLGSLLTSLGQMWAWERPFGRPEHEGLWDIAWFGPLQEASV